MIRSQGSSILAKKKDNVLGKARPKASPLHVVDILRYTVAWAPGGAWHLGTAGRQAGRPAGK